MLRKALQKLLTQGESEPFSRGNTESTTPDAYEGVGHNARGTGVSTRHAYGIESEGSQVEAPQQRPGPPSAPIPAERHDHDATNAQSANRQRDNTHHDVVDFESRTATPPTVVPD